MNEQIFQPLIFVRFDYSYRLHSTAVFIEAARIALETYNYTFGKDDKVQKYPDTEHRRFSHKSSNIIREVAKSEQRIKEENNASANIQRAQFSPCRWMTLGSPHSKQLRLSCRLALEPKQLSLWYDNVFYYRCCRSWSTTILRDFPLKSCTDPW